MGRTTPTSRRSRWTRSRSTSIASTCSFPRSVRSSSKTRGSSRSASAARPKCFSAGRSESAPTVSRSRSSAARGCRAAYPQRTSVGIINMQTAEEEVRGIPANNFSVARVQHELPNRSAVGAIFVNRKATGDLAGERDYNSSYAFDGRVGFGQNGLVNGFVARSQTPGLSGDQYAFNVGASHNTEKWRLGAGYAEVADDFNPEVGLSGARQRFPQDGTFGEPEHPAAAGHLLEIPRAAAARGLRLVLELRRSSRIVSIAPRPALAVAGGPRVSHGHEPDSRRGCRAVRDLPRRHRAGRKLRAAARRSWSHLRTRVRRCRLA